MSPNIYTNNTFASITEAIQHSLTIRVAEPVLKLHNKRSARAAKKATYKYTGLKSLFGTTERTRRTKASNPVIVPTVINTPAPVAEVIIS